MLLNLHNDIIDLVIFTLRELYDEIIKNCHNNMIINSKCKIITCASFS